MRLSKEEKEQYAKDHYEVNKDVEEFMIKRLGKDVYEKKKKEEAIMVDKALAWLEKLIELTDKGEFELLAKDYYKPFEKEKSVSPKYLEKNQKGHLALLRHIADHSYRWGYTGDHVAGYTNWNVAPGYTDDSIFMEVKDDSFVSEPLGTSAFLNRDIKKLKPKLIELSKQLKLSPWLLKELLRLKVEFNENESSSEGAIKSIMTATWPPEHVLVSKDHYEDELYVDGLTLNFDQNNKPKGFEECDASIIGYDSANYFGLASNEDDPLDPYVAIIDHEDPDSFDEREEIASIFFAKLKRKKRSTR